MDRSGSEPLLFLDVDGPLIPFGPRPGGHPTFAPDDAAHPLLGRLDPALGPRLAALPCELVWATSWGDDANDLIAPRLGLPPLPVVRWSAPEVPGLHWKTPDLCAWAAGRPFAWVDDEITDVDREWVVARHPWPTLLLRVGPLVGLTEADVAKLGRWLDRHGEPGRSR